MADPIIQEVKTAVTTEVKSLETKVFIFLQTHYSKAVYVAAGFAASHFNLVSFLFKVL